MDNKKLRLLKPSELTATFPQQRPLYIFIKSNDGPIATSEERDSLYPNFPARGFADLIRRTDTIHFE